MKKLPVGETIRFAYAFTFGDIGTVIGLIWIPAVINAVLGFLAAHNYNAGAAEIVASSGNGLPPGSGFMLLYSVAAVLLAAMMAVAITRQALGLRQGPALAHISLGAVELRVFGGIFALYLLFILFVIAVAVATAAVDGLVVTLAPGLPILQILAFAVFVVGLGAALAAMVRLSFLFVPSAVAEGGFGIARSWQMTQGNFWQIVGIGLATAGPVLALILIAQLVILGPEYLASVAAAMRDQAHSLKYTAEQMRLMDAKLPVLLGFGFVITPITNGLLFATAAYAYRMLSAKGADSPQ